MRKFALFLILMMGVGFVACEKPEVDEVVPVLPSPEAVVVDDDACAANTIVLLFDGSAAVKAGAKSFTSTLTSSAGSQITMTKEATSADAFRHVHKNLPLGVYTASVTANYPETVGVEANPVYVTDSKGQVVKFKVEGAAISAKLAYATSSTLAFTWSVSNFREAAKDIATAYSFGIYRDADCKDLIVSWQTKAGDSIWTDLADGFPQFEFSGLDAATSYWFVVEVVGKEAATAPMEAKTLDFQVVEPNAAVMVEAGGIAVAEDFSELVWGANYMAGSAAYSADDRNLATAFDKAEGVNPVNGGPWKWYLVDPSIEIGLFNTMKHAVENSRLAKWGLCNEIANNGNASICGRCGFLKIGASSKTSLICTPELTNLKSVATIEVQFDQARFDTDPTTAAVFVITDSQHGGKAGGYEVTPSYDNLTPAAEFTIKPGRTFTTEKIVLKNVYPGSRIGIGPIRKDGSTSGASQHRMFLDNVIVKVVAYETTAIELAKPVITSAVATTDEIKVKWNEVEKASGYVLEYKESTANEYTAVELGKVLEYTLTNLKGAVEYQVRIKAVEKNSQSESEYSDVVTATTLVKASFPMVASTADEFIAILSNEGLRTASATDEIQITANLDLTGKTLPASPIFTGTLVGNNCVISGVTSDHALFASVHSAKDLTIDESCKFTSTKAGLLAALAAEATGTISNVVNKANVTINMTTATDTTVAVAGIVAVSDAGLENCKNYGAVTYTNTAASHGALVAGLAGYCQGAVTKCENNAKVTMSVPYISEFGVVKNVTNYPIHIGGLVAHLGVDAPMSECVNNGDIDYDITALEKLAQKCGTNRPRMGGIVGLAQSSITSCINNGKVDVSVVTSDNSVYTTNNYPINVAGISGGAPADATGATGSDITECINNGEIVCTTYYKGTVPTCGGIVAYPGFEDPSQTNLITRCENKAKITATTFAIARVGGISGGTGNITHCKNTGEIEGHLSIEDGNIGGIIGFLSQGHKFEYNESICKLSNTRVDGTSGTSEIGGLIGEHGNVVSCAGEGRGCVVNCDISYDYTNEKWFGAVLGYFWGTAGNVTLGTADEPIKILGGSMTYTGGTTQITADNYTLYTNHSSAGGKSGSKAFTIYVKFGE